MLLLAIVQSGPAGGTFSSYCSSSGTLLEWWGGQAAPASDVKLPLLTPATHLTAASNIYDRMGDYTYDQSGIYFSFFLAAFLSLILVPYTALQFLTKKPVEGCHCGPCLQKNLKCHEVYLKATQSKRQIKRIFLLLLWLVNISQIYQVLTTTIQGPKVYDPFEVLNVATDATKRQIALAYRKLARKFHPDKNPIEKKEESSKLFVKITKAYRTLTIPELKKKWEDFGDPEQTTQWKAGIALPTWIIDSGNSPFVLGGYLLMFGFVMPYFIRKWWGKQRQRTKDKILYSTMDMFFRRIDQKLTTRDILALCCEAKDFEPKELNFDQNALKKYPMFENQIKLKDSKVWSVLIAHIFRYETDDQTIVRFLHLLQKGVLEVCLAKEYLLQSMFTLDCMQMITQAMWESMPAAMQVPNETFESTKNIKSIYDAKETKDSKLFFENFPNLCVKKATCLVLGEKSIYPNSLVTCSIDLSVKNTKEFKSTIPDALDLDGEGDGIKVDLRKSAPYAHCPYFPALKRPTWYIFVSGVSNRIIAHTQITDLIDFKTVHLPFEAPSEVGSYSFIVTIQSDHFVGTDVKITVNIQVVTRPPVEEIEDDISEPDQDSFQGQMQKLRAQDSSSDEE